MTARTLTVLVVLAAGFVPAAGASARTYYVQGGAPAAGKGTRARPLATLAAVEAASRNGDRIVVLPSATALDGGIRLKPRQSLVGAGPAVTSLPSGGPAPRITNGDRGRLDGDGVRLASGTTVRNLRITGTQRGAIYGRDITRATVAGNDVSGHNRACVKGFLIPPLNVPLIISGAGIPISDGLTNGWAGIMVDASRRPAQLQIDGNRVHDAECGDGIDIRASGTAQVRAIVSGNDVRELREGADLQSILAIGLQARDNSRLVARLDGNHQSGLGNDEDFGTGPSGADSEGIFVNPVGHGRLRAIITGNTYEHTPGRGGFSANGLEFVSMGDGARGLVDVRDSIFSGPPGDVIEQLALGTNAVLRLRLHDVVAKDSSGFSGTGIGDTVVIPGNDADCVIAASGGAGNQVDLVLRRTRLTNCANNGLTLGSSVANGTGESSSITLDVADSAITRNHAANLRIGNLSGLDTVRVRVQNTDLSAGGSLGSSPANLTVEDLGSTRHTLLDLGGGGLGSTGGNCLQDGLLSALVLRYPVSARGNWWGTPGGPAPGRTLTVAGTLDTGGALNATPPACRPATRPPPPR